MKLGLIGKSIQYSLSPKIHNFWLKKNHMRGEYVLIDQDFEEIIKLLQRGGFDGLNVTVPYKTKILDFVEEQGKTLGAVNTLKFTSGSEILAINTDYQAASSIFAEKPGSRIVILGSGGAARAMIAAAQASHAQEIHVVSRKPIHGSFAWHPWEDRHTIISCGGWLVNATTIKDDTLLNDWELVGCCHDVLDLTYKQSSSPYLTEVAEQLNISYITGKIFLLRQAQRSFHYWTGILPEIDAELIEVIA